MPLEYPLTDTARAQIKISKIRLGEAASRCTNGFSRPPVGSIKCGFAASFLMSRPPILYLGNTPFSARSLWEHCVHKVAQKAKAGDCIADSEYRRNPGEIRANPSDENSELNFGQILTSPPLNRALQLCHRPAKESTSHKKVNSGILLVDAKWFANKRVIAVKVIRAKAMGMCFGVKDALSTIMMIDYPEKATIYGQLVHNPEVLKRIEVLGFSMLEESNRTPAVSTPSVVITAHGLSDKERGTLEASGKTLIDTTCPLVSRVHQIAKGWQEQGYFVVVVGRKDHVEVRGIVGDLERCAVVETPEDVTVYPADRIAVVCQTTTPPDLRDDLFETISRKNAGKVIQFVDTICGPTRERQQAVEDLLAEVQALVVVGGKNSNNTRQLRAVGEKAGLPCFQVERASELRPEWFYGLEIVGLTAGTSTLDETIDEVYRALMELEE